MRAACARRAKLAGQAASGICFILHTGCCADASTRTQERELLIMAPVCPAFALLLRTMGSTFEKRSFPCALL